MDKGASQISVSKYKHNENAQTINNIPVIVEWLKNNKEINSIDLTIQAEMAGPSIQGNNLELNTYKLFIFNLFDPKTFKYYNWEIIKSFCDFSHIPSVPFKEYTTFKWNNVKEMEKYVEEDFPNSIYPKNKPREGLVFRALNKEGGLYLPDSLKGMNGCFSWKCINPAFAIKE